MATLLTISPAAFSRSGFENFEEFTMFLATVIDPEALSAELFDSETYHVQLDAFLSAARDNVYILVDKDETIKAEILQRLQSLPVKYKTSMLTLWADLQLPGKKKRIITTTVPSGGKPSTSRLRRTARAIYDELGTDGFVLHDENCVESRSVNPKHLLSLRNYSTSEFERRRRQMFRGSVPLNQMHQEEAADLIFRSIRFSKRLKFYDQYICNGGDPENFRCGIGWILNAWCRSNFCKSSKRSVEIYTAVDVVRKDIADHRKDQATAKVVKPLESEFGVKISLSVKEVRDPETRDLVHARYLESDTTILQFDPGFDFVNCKTGSLRTTEVKYSEQSIDRLNRWRTLPEATQ
jgi:hypothetical protein